MLAEPLTARQFEVLALIRAFIDEHRMAPTLAELAEKLGISRISVREQIDVLVRKGYLRRKKYKERALTLVDPAENNLRAWAVLAVRLLSAKGERKHAAIGRKLLREA